MGPGRGLGLNIAKKKEKSCAEDNTAITVCVRVHILYMSYRQRKSS